MMKQNYFFKTFLFLLLMVGSGTFQAYDALGRELFRHEVNSQFSILNSQFPQAGVYILKLNGQSQKIVIKN